MLTTNEIVKKVRELEIKSKKLTRHLFKGEYHSAFKGRGMLFKEVREYHHGDDIRFIDWNVSARFNHPFSKVFEEERELTVMLLIDISASSLFGTSNRKRDLSTEIGAVLAFSAVSNNDKVGVLFFSDVVEKFIPPKKGRDHVLYIVRELLTIGSKNKGTNLTEAFRRFNNATRQRCITFVLSDLLDNNFEDALKVAGKKHDVIGVKVYDKMDMELPAIGLIEAKDAETGERKWIDTNDFLTRQNYQATFFQHTALCKNIFRKAGCDLLHIRTDEDYVKVLQKFFISRN
ncbi:MAG TPA: DUF58 domain-containing protein [Flavitalea sp.]|nr:DUF58 domain-containing protein [Flavitalea sp.]